VNDRRVVRRYAAALYAAARAADAVDAVESDLGLIAYTVEAVPGLADVLSSPVVSPARKRGLVAKIFGDKVHEITLRYLCLLIDKRREKLVTHTEAEYVRLANEARGVTLARVTTAVELTEQEIERLRERLSLHTGQRIELQLEIDEAIIGGVVVRIGDTVLDGSIAGFLERLREHFLSRGLVRE